MFSEDIDVKHPAGLLAYFVKIAVVVGFIYVGPPELPRFPKLMHDCRSPASPYTV